MAVKDTLQIGDPRLKAKTRIIEDINSAETKRVVEDLVETMRENGLVGMAAPQIGESWRVFVTEPRQTGTRPESQVDELRVYINPEIIEMSKEESVIYKGCGSVAHGGLFGPVKRSKEVVVEALGADGKKFRLQCDGLLARVILHEYDHLEGVEFTEKIDDYGKLLDEKFYRQFIKESGEAQKACLITKKYVTLL